MLFVFLVYFLFGGKTMFFLCCQTINLAVLRSFFFLYRLRSKMVLCFVYPSSFSKTTADVMFVYVLCFSMGELCPDGRVTKIC